MSSILLHVLLFISFHSEHSDDANNINPQSNQKIRIERNEVISTSSVESLFELDDPKPSPKNEYTRSQLLELRHNNTNDMSEKAKNMAIAARIIKKNAERKLAEANAGGAAAPAKGGGDADAAGGVAKGGHFATRCEIKGLIHAKCDPTSKEEPKEPSVDDFWSKATTASSNRSPVTPDQSKNFALRNPWDKCGYEDLTEFDLHQQRVTRWLNAENDKMPTQFTHDNPDFSMDSDISSSMPALNERKRTDTSSLVSDVSTKSAARTQLLNKTAKLKETLSKLKQQKSNN